MRTEIKNTIVLCAIDQTVIGIRHLPMLGKVYYIKSVKLLLVLNIVFLFSTDCAVETMTKHILLRKQIV